MGSLRFNEYSDSPTIFLPHHQQAFGPLSHQPHPQPMQAFQTSFCHQSHQSQWKPAAPSRPVLQTNPSHKRSRDEFDDEPTTPTLKPSRAVQQEPVVYGEGMTIINPSTGRAAAAESQTGTWYEENLEIERLASIEAAKSLAQAAEVVPARPTKALRLEKMPDSSLSSSVGTPCDVSGKSPFKTPVLDPATHLLGIGWTLISKDEHMQAAAKGWARYIDNHYPSLSNAQLVLKSEGHRAYLVSATNTVEGTQGFYLFAEDLNEGKLVAQTWEVCLKNLQTSSPVFEGQETLKAVRTPIALDCGAMEEAYKLASDSAITDPRDVALPALEGALDGVMDID
ncbi:hypothetical protein MMC30_003925 [Trapelia coarctata]|nr:hypothetical protein [Trapelia coarctata]